MFHVKQQKSFDVIVVRAGHAGVEAAVMSSLAWDQKLL